MILEYKGYLGKVEFDADQSLYHGEITNIRDVITFQGRTPDELSVALTASVEDYLTFCREAGRDPQKP